MDKSIYSAEQEALSRLLRELRSTAGLRQVDVAERLGVPQSFVSKYESGERRLDAVELRQLALVFGMSISALVDLWDERLEQAGVRLDRQAALRSREPAGGDET